MGKFRDGVGSCSVAATDVASRNTRGVRWFLAGWVSLAVVAGCSGAGAGGADADGGVGDGGGGLEIAPPEPPDISWLDAGQPEIEPPRFLPCPPGWREVTDADTGTVTCDPWPETGYVACTAIDEAHFPGEAGCTRIGTACSADDDWAVDLPTDRPIVYVRAGATPGGDGRTKASPFGTIEDAMVGVASGAVIALARGRYDEVVAVPGGVTLWGACVAETVVAFSAPSEMLATIAAAGNGAAVRNLRVEGERMGVRADGRGSSLELRDVVVTDVVAIGVRVGSSSRLIADSLVIRETRSAPSSRMAGRGLNVSGGATAEVRRGVFERNRDVAVIALDSGTSVTLEDVVVCDTQSLDSDLESGRVLGRGLGVKDGAVARVTRGVFERNRDIAVFANQAGVPVTLTLEDVVVRDTLSRESDRTRGQGLGVEDGAIVVVTHGLFERNRGLAIMAAEGSAPVTLTLDDVVVRDTLSEEGEAPSDRIGGRGLEVQGHAVVTVTRGVFERNRDVAVRAAHNGASVALAKVTVRDTQGRDSDRAGGRGLDVEDGAVASVTLGVFERNRDVAIFAAQAATPRTLTLEDVVVRNTESADSDRQADRVGGRGLGLQGGAVAQVTRGVFEGNRDIAVFVAGATTTLTLEDVVARDTRSRESDLRFGRGLDVQDSAAVLVRRGLFEGNRDLSIAAFNASTLVTLENVVVRQTEERECADDSCVGAGAGGGIGSYSGAHVEAGRFLVTGSALCGLQLAHGRDESGPAPLGGTVELHDGEISFNAVCGANVQTEGFDLGDLQDRVIFHDNGRDLDMSMLPVPDSSVDL